MEAITYKRTSGWSTHERRMKTHTGMLVDSGFDEIVESEPPANQEALLWAVQNLKDKTEQIEQVARLQRVGTVIERMEKQAQGKKLFAQVAEKARETEAHYQELQRQKESLLEQIRTIRQGLATKEQEKARLLARQQTLAASFASRKEDWARQRSAESAGLMQEVKHLQQVHGFYTGLPNIEISPIDVSSFTVVLKSREHFLRFTLTEVGDSYDYKLVNHSLPELRRPLSEAISIPRDQAPLLIKKGFRLLSLYSP